MEAPKAQKAADPSAPSVRDEDTPLLAECLSRDPVTANRSFEQLVKKHQEMIYALGYRFFGNHDDAAEIVQRTFIRVHQKLATFRQASRFRTWLYQIALNLCRNFKRDEGRHTNRKTEITEREEQIAAPTGDDPTQAQEERVLLRRAIDELPPMQKSVVLLRVYDELSFQEIGEIVGSSEGSAKVNFHHAMKHLKDFLSTLP